MKESNQTMIIRNSIIIIFKGRARIILLILVLKFKVVLLLRRHMINGFFSFAGA